jgi:hypothetical protein
VPIGAAWPSAAVTPVLRVHARPDEVHAFRVETNASHGSVDYSADNEYLLGELPVSASGWVSPQTNLGCDYTWSALGFCNLKHHSVMVRLYRPGCQTVEVGSWDLPHEIKWTGAADLAGQEKAVDDLLETWQANMYLRMFMRQDRERHPSQEPSPESLFGCLAPGSKSPGYHQALLFAASEYERLAKATADDPSAQAIRDRMMNKATWLRERALQ